MTKSTECKTAKREESSAEGGRQNSRRPSLLCFGEVLWDLIEEQTHLGGASLNLAAHAVGCGSRACLFSRVGDDDLGRRALAAARGLGVDTRFIGVDQRQSTGTVSVKLSPEGQPSFTIQTPAAWDFIEADETALRCFQKHPVDAICFGTLAQRNPVSRASLKRLLELLPATPAFFDVNLRQAFYSGELLEEGLKRTTVLKLNDSEVAVLAHLLLGQHANDREFAQAMLSRYRIQIVLVTRGARGCLVADHTGMVEVPGRPVAVVDTVGAGDAFSAAFLSFWLHGASPVEAAGLANDLGAFVASCRGAVPPYSDAIRNRLGLAPCQSVRNAA
jgi:fructokinase